MSSEELLLGPTTISWDSPEFDEEELQQFLSMHGLMYFLAIVDGLLRLWALTGNIYLIVIIARLKGPKNRINVIILLYEMFNSMYLILPLSVFCPN